MQVRAFTEDVMIDWVLFLVFLTSFMLGAILGSFLGWRLAKLIIKRWFDEEANKREKLRIRRTR